MDCGVCSDIQIYSSTQDARSAFYLFFTSLDANLTCKYTDSHIVALHIHASRYWSEAHCTHAPPLFHKASVAEALVQRTAPNERGQIVGTGGAVRTPCACPRPVDTPLLTRAAGGENRGWPWPSIGKGKREGGLSTNILEQEMTVSTVVATCQKRLMLQHSKRGKYFHTNLPARVRDLILNTNPR